jgi:hypothetical protein
MCNQRQLTHCPAFYKPVKLHFHWWICGGKWSGTTRTQTRDPLIQGPGYSDDDRYPDTYWFPPCPSKANVHSPGKSGSVKDERWLMKIPHGPWLKRTHEKCTFLGLTKEWTKLSLQGLRILRWTIIQSGWTCILLYQLFQLSNISYGHDG